MARIPEYEPNVDPISPLPGRSPERLFAEPQSFGSQTAEGLERIGEAGTDVAERLYDVQQHQEVSDVMAQMAQKRGQWTAALDTRAASMKPGDPTFSSGFMNDVTNDLQTIGGTVHTRAGRDAFQRESAALTGDMLAASTRMQVASAGVKAKDDYLTTQNANAGTLFHDPSQFDSIMAQTKAAFADPSGPFSKMDPEARSNLEYQAQQTYAMAAARGITRINPQLAQDMYNKGTLPGQSFLSEQSNYTILGEIQTGINGQRIKSMQAMEADERAKRIAGENDGRAIIADLVKNPTDPNITDKILASRLPWQQQNDLLTLSGHELKAPHDVSAYGTGFYDLYQKVHLAPGTPGAISSPQDLYKHVGPGGDLTVEGVDKLTAEIMGRRTPEGAIEGKLKDGFIKAASQQLSGTNELLHLRDPKGDMMQQEFLSWFLPAFEKAKAAGKYTPEQLLDPSNPNSMWSHVQQFKRTPQQFMQDMMDANYGMKPAQAQAAEKASEAAPVMSYNSAADVAAAYKAGKITRDEAAGLLRSNKWAQ